MGKAKDAKDDIWSPPEERIHQEVDFDSATRGVLFGPVGRNIPGAGRSATETPGRHVKVKVTINLDGDVVQFFKQRAQDEGVPYQLLINQILREHVEGTRPEQIAREVKRLVLSDPAFLATLSQQVAEQLNLPEPKEEEPRIF